MHTKTTKTPLEEPHPYHLSKRSRIAWIIAVILLPVVTVFSVFMLTDDGIVPFEDSPTAQYFTQIQPAVAATSENYSTTFGQPGDHDTLVLYDDEAEDWAGAETYAMATANLATHFGTVEIMRTDDYSSQTMKNYDAAIFLGVDWQSELPQELLDDVRAELAPVMWLGENAEHLTEGASQDGKTFVEQYGWDPDHPLGVDSANFKTIMYKEQDLTRVSAASGALYVPNILDTQRVTILAEGSCATSEDTPSSCPVIDGESPHGNVTELEAPPWAISSGNLIYVSEIPLDYIDQNDAYIIFADLYYELLQPEIEPIRQAAVRIEDVNPESDPDDLRAVADLLHAKNEPFQVAVIPVMINRAPNRESWYGLTLLDKPEVIEALKYMQDKGATLIQHGTTHQYGDSNNPYSGRSGEDYEFFGYGCSATEFPPYEWEGCKKDSWVRKTEALPADDIADHQTRLEYGFDIMVAAGLEAPTVFVTPHYTASPNAYRAMANIYDARYEQVEYYAGMISGGDYDPEESFGQIFPYSVHDIYGSRVFPENLQNVTETEQNNHAIRTPETLIKRAEKYLVVTESTASFYFHPFLDLAYLEELVDGVQELDYTFVPVDQLK